MKTIKVVSVEEMRRIEAAADQAGVTTTAMMEQAGQEAARAVLERLDKLTESRVTVLAGPGNNGGDGLVTAYYLAQAGVTASVYLLKRRPDDDPNLARLHAAGTFVVNAEDDQRGRVLKNLLGGADVVVDALFGTGAQLPLRDEAAELLRQAAQVMAARRRPVVVAVDVPSGMDCDTGQMDPTTLEADVTVSLAAAKRGQLVFPGANKVGELRVADIGIPADLPELSAVPVELATAAAVRDHVPARPRDAHKGTFGRVMVVGGSNNYAGAPYLAGAAAYRVGAGLVTLAVPRPLQPVIAPLLPDATWLPLPYALGTIAAAAVEVIGEELPKTKALVLGPGIGMDREARDFVVRLLRPGEGTTGRLSAKSSAGQKPAWRLPPMVVDADGLKHLTALPDWFSRLPEQCVLTPHPGEMAILTSLPVEVVQSDRLELTQNYSARWGRVVVLKGAFTVVAAPDGRTTLLPFATPALARAGTGDVLAGVIGGLLAQGLPAYEAAVLGGYLHGLAGELAGARLGTTAAVTASDVLASLAKALAEVARVTN